MALLLTSCSSKPALDLVNNKLKPCPNSPNCVNSFSKPDKKSYVEPIFYKTNDPNIINKIIVIIEKMPRTKLVTRAPNYLHFEFKTFLGFVDDVEIYISTENYIHFRSASRIGYYDFNKNYNRYLKIKNDLLSTTN